MRPSQIEMGVIVLCLTNVIFGSMFEAVLQRYASPGDVLEVSELGALSTHLRSSGVPFKRQWMSRTMTGE